MSKELKCKDIDFTESLDKAKMYVRAYVKEQTAAMHSAPLKSQKVYFAGVQHKIETFYDIDRKMTAHLKHINTICVAIHKSIVWDFDKEEEQPTLTGGLVE